MKRAIGPLLLLMLAGGAAAACGVMLGIDPPPVPLDAGADVIGEEPSTAPDAGTDATPGEGDSGAADAMPDIVVADGEAGDASTAYWSFSDNFDLGDLRLWTQTGQSQNGTLAVVDAGAYSGCCALHATASPGTITYQYALESWTSAAPSAPPVSAGTIAVRARIKPTALDVDTRELSMAQGGTAATAYATAGLGNSGGGFSWGFFLIDPANPPDAGGYSRNSAMVVGGPDGTWHCVEFVLNVSSSAGHLAIFLDPQDTQAVPVTQGATDTTAGVGWDSVTVGLGYSSGGSATDVLIDDVKIALYPDLSPTVHLGCGP